MNLYHLRSFYYTAKLGSITKAAHVLCVTQPAVTKQIQQLQNQSDLKFLNRIGKKMVLTDAGKVLFGIAEKIFEMESQAEESIRDFQQLKSGNIRILTSESFGAYYLPYIITSYNKLFPNICISADILTNEEVVENTLILNNDLGFLSNQAEHPKLVIREILEDSLILIVPPDHAFAESSSLEPRVLENHTLIMHERGSATRKIVDDFIRKNSLKVMVKWELSNNESIKRLVEQGLGLSIISKNIVKEELKSGRLAAIHLTDSILKRKYFLIHHKDKYFSKALQSFIEICLQWAAAY